MSLTQWMEISGNRRFRDQIEAARRRLGSRRGILIAATAALIAGAAFNWSWLVAAGIAPLLLAALPCAAMCALGLCMNRMTGQSCPSEAADARPSTPPADEREPTAPFLSSEVVAASRPGAGVAPPRRE